jgi:hypothetical protein
MISMIKIPNQFPALEPQGPTRIAIVLDFPDRESAHQGVALGGEAARLLEGALGHVGIALASCFVGNVSQVTATSFNVLAWEGEEVQSGIAQLRADLERFKPSIVVCMGTAALHLFRVGNLAPRKVKAGFDWPSKIGSWRGSLFESMWLASCVENVPESVIVHGVKCLAALPPAMVLRDYGLQAYYRTGVGGLGDLERLKQEMGICELTLPQRSICIAAPEYGWGVEGICAELYKLKVAGVPLGQDLEGYPGNVTCMAYAPASNRALVIPFAHIDGTSVWSEDEETRLWQAQRDLILENTELTKVGQNYYCYDAFALAWTYGIVVKNIEDAILAWWELFPELLKGLATQTSLLTRQPFYKPDKEDGELQFKSDEEFWTYNGIDACVTLECWEREKALMDAGQQSHYQFNISLLPAIRYMMLRGIKFDKGRAKEAREKASRGAMELQAEIDQVQAREDGLGTALCDLYANLMSSTASEEWFAALTLRCLGCKNPRVKVEVVEERWQPMRWNGKKWVKDGKRVDAAGRELLRANPIFKCLEKDTEPCVVIELGLLWLKPMHKLTLKRQPFAPASLSDCEPHILESKRAEWKRVKAIWKELSYGQTADRGNSSVKMAIDERSGLHTRSSALLGELSTLLGLAVNIGSTNQGGDAQRFLYETCGLRRIYKDAWTGRLSWEAEGEWRKRLKAKGLTCETEANQETLGGCDDVAGAANGRAEGEDSSICSAKPAGKRFSTDQQTLDKLYAATQDVRVLWCLQQRRLRLAATNLDKEIDDDGRIRSSISLVKETGRMAASESPMGTGTNLQSWDKHHRHVMVADEGCVMGQCDLEGADSWTVAAECAALGDTKMLEDLRAGLKPAKGLCFGYFEPGLYQNASTDLMKARLKELTLPDWLYPGAKSSLHGGCYGSGWRTTIDTILKYSMADLPLDLKTARPIVLSKEQVDKLRSALFLRYPGIKAWHAKTEKLLLTTGVLEMNTGHRRRIYQRKAEFKQGRKVACHETLKEVLSSAPQYYTTYSIKLALRNLWYADDNRDGEKLKVEPLLCVHDSILTQWRREDDTFARPFMREIFQNEILIAGQRIVIPAEGFCYSDWSMDKEKAEKL